MGRALNKIVGKEVVGCNNPGPKHKSDSFVGPCPKVDHGRIGCVNSGPVQTMFPIPKSVSSHSSGLNPWFLECSPLYEKI